MFHNGLVYTLILVSFSIANVNGTWCVSLHIAISPNEQSHLNFNAKTPNRQHEYAIRDFTTLIQGNRRI